MLKFKLKIEGGKAEYNQKQFDSYVAQQKDGYYTWEIKKLRKPRSLMQNRYYHGCIVSRLAEKFELDTDTMHETLKYLFLKEEFYCPLTSETICKILSTTSLNTKQMEEYLERIRQWAITEYGYELPLPNETEYNY